MQAAKALAGALLVIAGTACASSTGGTCNPQDGVDILNDCLSSIAWEPGRPCEGDGGEVAPPSGYAGGPDYDSLYDTRCRAAEQGAFMSCLATFCRQAATLYAIDGGTAVPASAVGTLVPLGQAWCTAEDLSPVRPSTCVESCNQGYPDVIPCTGGTWDACVTCEQDDYQTWEQCVSACTAVTTCSDGQKDGQETDIDCGGGTCRPCLDGKACNANSDCQSNHCYGNVCQVPTCSDGVQNQFEVDVDCGAFCGIGSCNVGKHCVADVDCSSTHCDAGTCQ